MQNKWVWMAGQWCACALLLTGSSLSAQMRTVTIPAGKTLQNALKKQVLGQEDGQPFHVVVQIAPAKGIDAEYAATIEETWLAKDRWVRTMRGPGIEQTVIANESGLHYVTAGVYFPLWLHAFEAGMFSPVDISQWNRGSEVIEWKVLPNGAQSTPCIHHEFMLGAEMKQINFANLCFNNDRSRLEMVQGPEFAVSFSDYEKFGKLKVPRGLSVEVGSTELAGKVTTLETPAADAHLPDVPANATTNDPMRFIPISTEQLERLAGDAASPTWPAQIPWRGQFTLWVAVDKTGKVRQVESRNSDLSGFAADMAKTLVGRQWKAAVADGTAVQVEGALVFDYPPKQGAAKGQ